MDEGEVQAASENLDKIYRKLSDKTFFLSLSGDALAYTATKIAALKARLVEVKREAEIEAKNAETDYKATKAQAIRRITGTPVKEGGAKISQSAASDLMYGEQDVIEASNRKTEAEALWNFVKSLTADGHDMIEAIRSRLIDLQGSRKDERV